MCCGKAELGLGKDACGKYKSEGTRGTARADRVKSGEGACGTGFETSGTAEPDRLDEGPRECGFQNCKNMSLRVFLLLCVVAFNLPSAPDLLGWNRGI